MTEIGVKEVLIQRLCTVVITGFLVLAFLAAPGLAAGDTEIQAILADRIDNTKRSVGIVVGVIDQGGKTVIGYGRRGQGEATIPDGDTVFEIGSVTKVFTAILLAEMAGQGEVAMEAAAASYLPDSFQFPGAEKNPITLYHLTTHTSGLPRMPNNFAPADPTNPYADYSVQQMYEFLSGHTPARAPGETAEYSNLGAGLLGHILAEVAGSDYETLVRKRISGPLEMTDTAILLTEGMKERLAIGHDATLKPTSNWDIPTLAGAGALRSTVHDMLLFVAANLGLSKSPISDALQDSHRQREEFGRPGMHIGLGWIIRQEHERTIHWHNGGTGGYHSFVGFDKERKKGVVVLSNSTDSIDDIGFHLLEPKFELAKFKSAKEAVDFDPELFNDYVGRYQLTPDFILSVSRDGNRFYIQATGQGKLEVFPESASRFFATVVEAAVSFHRGEDGKVSHMVLHQGGRDQKAERLGAGVAAVPAVEATSEVPASPVGKALNAWLEVTRGSDTEAARKHYSEAFDASFHAAVPEGTYMGMRAQLQGLLGSAALSRVVARSDHDLSAYANSNGTWLVIHIQVLPEEPHKIVGLLVQPTEPPEGAEPDDKE